jgi:hypothetical protein
VKEAKIEERASLDWQRATPVISKGSTFYKDLFDLRNKKHANPDGANLSNYSELNQSIME